MAFEVYDMWNIRKISDEDLEKDNLILVVYYGDMDYELDVSISDSKFLI